MSLYSPTTDPIISTKDYRGRDVIFSKDKWEEKHVNHPELLNTKFMKHVQNTIEDPEEVWQDYDSFVKKEFNKRCYYRKYSANSYVKVVIWFKGKPLRVVTAYEIDWIKESKYTGVKRLK